MLLINFLICSSIDIYYSDVIDIITRANIPSDNPVGDLGIPAMISLISFSVSAALEEVILGHIKILTKPTV